MKFIVTKCVDAFANYQALIHAESAAQAVEIAQEEGGDVQWTLAGHSEFDHVDWENIEPEAVADDFEFGEEPAVPTDPVAAAQAAVKALAYARDCLKAAGATRAVDKARLALSSAKGAVRHVENKVMRP